MLQGCTTTLWRSARTVPSPGHFKEKPSSGPNPSICDMRRICANEPSQIEKHEQAICPCCPGSFSTGNTRKRERRLPTLSVARLRTPLNQNATFYMKPRAPKYDFFTPLSIRMPLFTSSFELRSTTFSHPSQSEYNFVHQASNSGA
jgi:hypothetical protein